MVVAFVLIFCAVLLIRSLYHRAHISDPQPAVPARFHELADRIDPNMATWHELAVLPQLGEKRAKELVAYREDYLSRGQESIAFHRAEDLLRVKGMGAAMLETLRPYLTFPTTRRASTTSTSSPSI